MNSIYYPGMPEQKERPQEDAPWAPKSTPFDGPKDLSGDKPDTKNIMKKLKTISPEQAKRYKQRTGQ